MNYRNIVMIGDVLQRLKELPDGIVQCVVTSPPYWGLRDYGTAKWEGGSGQCDHKGKPMATRANINKNCGTGTDRKNAEAREPMGQICTKCGARRIDAQIGLEPTPEEYVTKMVEVFSEVKRVLRDDGVLWLNLGDSYNSATGPNNGNGLDGKTRGGSKEIGRIDRTVTTLKPKDLVGVPWRVAFALQADGWWLRSECIWYKRNPMPESVTDRPTKAHEQIFLLTKSARYFYDADAVRQKLSESTLKEIREGYAGNATKEYDGTGAQNPSDTKKRIIENMRRKQYENDHSGSGNGIVGHKGLYKANGEPNFNVSGANLRTVWDIPAQPYSGAHFATFPREIAERCIKAGSSEAGACECGEPLERETIKSLSFQSGSGKSGNPIKGKNGEKLQGGGMTGDIRKGPTIETQTTGFRKTCKHEAGPVVPCIVLDPFAGSGTTLEVAHKLGRDYIGIELNPKYVKENIEPRMHQAEGMFARLTVIE